MPVDLDELFARADRATAQSLPFRSELVAELTNALDEIETRFPNGHPGEDAPRSERVAYEMLQLDIESARLFLTGPSGVNWVDDPQPPLSLIAGGREDAS